MPPRASIRVQVPVMQKRADYSSFLNTDKLNLSGQIVRLTLSNWYLEYYKLSDKEAGQIQFVRVIFSMLFSP